MLIIVQEAELFQLPGHCTHFRHSPMQRTENLKKIQTDGRTTPRV